MKCKYCGREIPDDANSCPYCQHSVKEIAKTVICKYCGRKIPDDANSCPYCQRSVKETAKTVICSNCGKKISANANICPYCMQTTDKGQEEYQMHSGNSKKAVGVILCLFLSVLGLIIGLMLYPYGTDERSSFIKGWVGAFIASIVLGIIIYSAAVGCVATAYRR